MESYCYSHSAINMNRAGSRETFHSSLYVPISVDVRLAVSLYYANQNSAPFSLPRQM